ncbi:HlyD family secretion protein [Arcticibacter tournemirensis]|uniref:HlyD family efflux transporter periplasmic adaptor subunit n=1 Tax=Arcticibacter tournemirensis TaxID=699437 RepID=A0A5M9HFL7_9SPHI|nr:efflux RND transporter periplasmic adaptor subunit [Arcticibacter tournemirensis]KAA8485580.1 HlyD family efflux transporter periplasmic adaptor subunit [Arcticibacter tournemirensis]TQM48703.1 HlyD family secretion protein [Arcticibacter tournemirensis]
MKTYIAPFFLLLTLSACHSNDTQTIKEPKPRTAVQITQVGTGAISDDLVLSGTSVYLKRNMVTSSIAAFITNVYVKLGDHVRKGQSLYLLESKERKALGADITKVDPSLKGFGLITVTAPASGIITTFDKQQTGEYVLEGTQLCTIAASNDLAFQVNVPYEYADLVKPGKKCVITLPDGSAHQATITTPLATMNAAEQTQVLLARPDQTLFLPENLLGKVTFNRSAYGNQQVLPKSCVVSDELLKDFWVMKLVNDSTAIKVPVKTGNKNKESIEILSPKFQNGDKILISGNYGLADTALVTVVK